MKQQDAAALGASIASCREQMESDLCELFEDLGPVLTQMAIARNETSRDRRERVAAAALQHDLPSVWEKVSPSLRNKLKTRDVIAATSDYGAAEQPTIRLLSHEEESVHLAMRKVLERITLSCRDETRALDRRLNYLVLRRAMQPRDSTFKIPALWSCIEAACAEVVTDTDALILLLQLIGEQMTAELPELYRVVNEAMIEADILPRLKRGYRDVIPVDAQEVAEESTRVASILDRLVQARTAEGSASKAPGPLQPAANCSRHSRPCRRRPRH